MATQAADVAAEPTFEHSCTRGVSSGFGKRTNAPPLEKPPSVRPSRNWNLNLKSPYCLAGYQSMPRPPTGEM